MIIEYLLGYSQATAIAHCGHFDDLASFKRFRLIEASYGRIVYKIIMVKHQKEGI